MLKLSSAVHPIATLFLCAGFAILPGCGSPQEQADKDAKAAVAQADVDRAKAGDSADKLTALDAIQKTYDNLANSNALSPEMQVLLRSRQSQLRLERIMMMLADLRGQELLITRDISQINELAAQVGAAQSIVEALKSYDSGASVQKLSAQRDQIQGSASALTWEMQNATPADPNAKVTSPTLFAVNQEIDSLNNQIQQNQADTDAAHKLSSSKGDEAETYLRRAEGETGNQNVADTNASANDRRDAAYADSKAATLANNLIQLQAKLDAAKDQQTALQAAVKSLDDQVQAQQTRWTTIQAKIKDQQDIQQQLINGSSSSTGLAMAGLAQDLAQNMTAASKLRDNINGEINSVVPHLNSAITICNQLRQDWVTDVREKGEDPDAIIWRQAQETLHPMYFNLEVASALEAKASVAAAKARIDQMVYDMYAGAQVDPAQLTGHFKNLAISPAQGPIKIPGLTELLNKDKTGIDMPKSFGDVPPPDSDELKQSQDDANKAFQDTIDTYDKKYASTDTGPAADERRNLSLAGEAHADREWAEFAAFTGNTTDAKNHLQAAQDAESQIDPSFTLAANAVSNGTPGQPATPGGLAPRPAGAGVQ